VRIAYADPPYPGCAHLYPENTEVDHAALVKQLEGDFDGYILHTSSTALRALLPLVGDQTRPMAWVKPFAAFKRNVPVAYAWEPVLVKACRKPVVSGRVTMRDWVSERITMKKGLVGAKPHRVCKWAFEVVGAKPGDEIVDLFPGTGAVMAAWDEWCGELLHWRENRP
jgi:hypothetical protein